MRHAVVTGGTRGIGAGVAAALLDQGWKVTATGVTDEEVAACEARDNLEAVRLDVTDEAAVAALFGRFDRLDGLVNCAGIITRAGAEFTVAGFRKTIEVNLIGTMACCLAARTALAHAGGAIVNTASMFSFFGSPLTPGYSASKGGIAQLTKSLAAAWAGENIRVNAVAPGWIETEMTRPLLNDETRAPGILGRTPMKRWGKPGDVGSAAAFLLSDAARFVTGTVLPVDGGYLVM